MNQGRREPDPSTNLPHGEQAEPSGRSDVERDTGGEENVPIERVPERGEEGSIEGAKASSEEVPTTLRTGEGGKSSTVERLNDLLRGELASVETYTLALSSVKEPELSSTLEQIRTSHEHRASRLREKIQALGGEPAHGSGAWGAFARIVQRGADLLGERAAIAALEEGEDQGKKRYAKDLDELEPKMREFVLHELSPEQQKTHDLAQSLKRFVKAA